MGLEAPGAPQTPEIEDFRPAQNSCIKNPGVHPPKGPGDISTFSREPSMVLSRIRPTQEGNSFLLREGSGKLTGIVGFRNVCSIARRVPDSPSGSGEQIVFFEVLKRSSPSYVAPLVVTRQPSQGC